MIDGVFREGVSVSFTAAPCLNFLQPLYKASEVLILTLIQACLPMIGLLHKLKISPI